MQVSSTLSVVILVAVTSLSVSCSQSAEPTSDAAAPHIPKDAVVFDFSQGKIGTVPDGFTAALTGGGEPVKWHIQQVKDAPSGDNVLTQLSNDETSVRYPHIVLDDFSAKDVDLSVKFKTVSGKVDASAGLIFRYRNNDNFYVVRANSLEGNVVAYKTEHGKRHNTGVKGKGDAYGVNADVPHQEWNTLRVIVTGTLIEVFLNNRKLFEVEDDTFTEAGTIGLWTKADAITQFDNFTVKTVSEDVD